MYEYDPELILREATHVAIKAERRNLNCWIAYEKEQPIGFLVAHASPMLWTSRLHAYQDIWYVLPNHRNGRASILLLKAFEAWSKHIGAIRSTLTVALHNTDDVERVSKLFDRLGYLKAGYYHVKEM
jgi:hypothetical protein